MRLRCPNCRTDLDILPVETTVEVKCPSCGSMVDISGSEDTIAYTPPKLGKLAHFELLKHIGRGHFGDVYKANDTRLERIVAVKIPRAADLGFMEREAFFREARTAARLRHPNIVTIHDVNSSGETIYIASEFIPGANLADRIFGKPLEPKVAAAMAAKIADALQHAHEQGVIHRDLKPRNIMLDAQGEPHLLDFGLAKRDAADFTITTAGEILGTPAYMAPEQARGDAHSADARTDVYSLGVTLYEMLTGTRPFMGDARGLIYQVLHDEPASPRKLEKEIPRDLETICLKAMAKEPSRRYQSAGEMAADLKRFLAGDAIQARRAGMVERSWRWCRKNPAWCAAWGLAIVALISVTLVALGSVPPAGPLRRIEIGVNLARTEVQDDDDPPANLAELVFWPLSREGWPQTDRSIRRRGKSPFQLRLPPGDYFVVAVVDSPAGQRFHEVFRRVPLDGEQPGGVFRHQDWIRRPEGVIELHPISVPLASVADNMARFRGSNRFVMGMQGMPDLPRHARRILPFRLDRKEVTVGDYDRYPIGSRPQVGAAPPNFPLTGVYYDQALAWAESTGKRLPWESEYEFAASPLGGFPWAEGAEKIPGGEWPIGPVDGNKNGYDVTAIEPRAYGLFSNAAEWTASWSQPYPGNDAAKHVVEPRDHRVVRGAPPHVVYGGSKPPERPITPRDRILLIRPTFHPKIGFRCARSERPHLQPEDFETILDE